MNQVQAVQTGIKSAGNVAVPLQEGMSIRPMSRFQLRQVFFQSRNDPRIFVRSGISDCQVSVLY
jgi:hypothetical protein